MFSYEERLRAVRLYIKSGKRLGLTIRQLGYPTRNALKIWFREYEQRLDLPAVTALVTAVAVLAQVRLAALHVALEVGAGQVVQQHVELGIEEFAPAPAQEFVQLILVFDEPIQAAVQRVLLGQREVRVEQVRMGHEEALSALVSDAPGARPPTPALERFSGRSC